MRQHVRSLVKGVAASCMFWVVNVLALYLLQYPARTRLSQVHPYMGVTITPDVPIAAPPPEPSAPPAPAGPATTLSADGT